MEKGSEEALEGAGAYFSESQTKARVRELQPYNIIPAGEKKSPRKILRWFSIHSKRIFFQIVFQVKEEITDLE